MTMRERVSTVPGEKGERQKAFFLFFGCDGRSEDEYGPRVVVKGLKNRVLESFLPETQC